MELSEMEKEYEQYLTDPAATKIINGIKYYKAVHIDELNNKEKGRMVVITLPYAVFGSGKADVITDERGNVFHLNPPAMISFRDCTPKWHMECGTFMIKDADSTENLGEYFTEYQPAT